MYTQPLISVIIPVYNGEKYIERAMMSIINQPMFEKMELIVVNDGSKDSSGSIANKIAEKYPSVHVIHKENGGVSAARNDAISIANGVFIGFCDADDWWEKDAIDDALVKTIIDNESLPQKIDLYGFSHNTISCNYKFYYSHHAPSFTTIFDKKERREHSWSPFWCFLYRTKLLQDNKIFFPVCKINEDTTFLDFCFYHAGGIMSLDKILYNWLSNTYSVSHSTKATTYLQEVLLSIKLHKEYFSSIGVNVDIDYSIIYATSSRLSLICAFNNWEIVSNFFRDPQFSVLKSYKQLPLTKKILKTIKPWVEAPYIFFIFCKLFVFPVQWFKLFLYRHPKLRAFPDRVFYKLRGYKAYTG